MGNCLRRQPVHQRPAGDDDGWEWEAPAPERRSEGGPEKGKKKSQEVKIKITRKQLEELLGKVDVKELTVEQVLVCLMDGRDRFEENQTSSWRPVLQSIPE